jgi:hypothetical protein
MRPRGVRDLRHQAVYLFGAVCPARDAGVALVLPTVNAVAMQAMLDELAQAVSPGAQAVVFKDRAGWHIAHELAVPANHLPACHPSSTRSNGSGCICANAFSPTSELP